MKKIQMKVKLILDSYKSQMIEDSTETQLTIDDKIHLIMAKDVINHLVIRAYQMMVSTNNQIEKICSESNSNIGSDSHRRLCAIYNSSVEEAQEFIDKIQEKHCKHSKGLPKINLLQFQIAEDDME